MGGNEQDELLRIMHEERRALSKLNQIVRRSQRNGIIFSILSFVFCVFAILAFDYLVSDLFFGASAVFHLFMLYKWIKEFRHERQA